ncbi:hypothetical protein IVG45_03850 [Methylomonas sp. LL1]|uniref:hypothetical protein n=1 Tax=Methylomonas sp. LL1 TaxID=2785785 RepID=UPI0018C43A36|nr:hypothetical protein [Methylomonas sp. LL1]QPK64116.1 hypothetical protein IVG45_03850 [Methylomonas sp. LL1]
MQQTIITLSGTVYGYANNCGQNFLSIGDCRLKPGANGTRYIDACVFDGKAWRTLSIKGFGSVNRTFECEGDIGSVMQQMARSLIRLAGMPVYYDYPHPGARKRAYVFKGIPFNQPSQNNPAVTYC